MEEPAAVKERTFLAAMARRYVWDQTEEEALAFPDRLIRRVMDLGTLADVLDLEPLLGRDLDIAAMLEGGQTLENGLGAAVALFPHLPPCEVAGALVDFEGGDLSSLSPSAKAILVARVRRLGVPSIVRRLSSSLSA